MSYPAFLSKKALEASQKAAEDLADLRGHRGYQILLDVLHGEIRQSLRVVLDPDKDDSQVYRARQTALALQDALGFLEGILTRKDLQEAQEAVMNGFTADEEILTAQQEALAQAGQLPPGGGGVYE